MDFKNVDEFCLFLTRLLTVAMSETDGWIDAENKKKTSLKTGREFLIDHMKGLYMNKLNDGLIYIETENENIEELEKSEETSN